MDKFKRARACVVAGLINNPAAPIGDPALLARLDDPSDDCPFEELGLDSLGAMELCIHIECETRVALSTEDLVDHPSVKDLAMHLSARMGRRGWFRR